MPVQKYTDYALLDALVTASKTLGDRFSRVQYERLATTRGLPHWLTIANRFGTWKNAQRAAGLETNDVRGRVPGSTTADGTHSWKHSKGYRMTHRDGARVLEHRAVMERLLGRELLPGESVHHKNGQRDDNRPANLELRVSYHPHGQTVPDLLAWAHEILERYDNLS